MAKLKNIRIENVGIYGDHYKTIIIDWDNDIHQMIGIMGRSPDALIDALSKARSLLICGVNSEKI